MAGEPDQTYKQTELAFVQNPALTRPQVKVRGVA